MLLSILLASALLGFADEQAPVRARQVAATVDNEPIATAEVDREIALAVKGQTLQEEALSRLKKLALEQVIDRHLILKYLQANKQAASKDDVDFALARLVRQLKAKNTPLADHLKAIGMSEAELRQELLWKISWARYVEASSSDENLKKYFDLHRADFDGTE